MISKVYSIVKTPNLHDWKIDVDGHGFENHVYKVILRKLSYDSRIKVIKTTKVADQGRDIEIVADTDFEIFGINFLRRNNRKIRLFIECKSTNSGRLSLEKFGKNSVQVLDEEIDYFVLVTNSTITPYAFHKTADQFVRNNIEFILIDEFLLKSFLLDEKAGIPSHSPVKFSIQKTVPSVSIEYQWLQVYIDSKKVVELYIVIRNYNKKVHPCKIYLKTDRNWVLDHDMVSDFVEPHKIISHKFLITKNYNDGVENLDIGIDVNNKHNAITITHPDLKLNFVPPFFGQRHQQFKFDLQGIIQNNDNLKIVNIYGNAGIGKSRIIDEALSSFIGSNIKISRVYFEQNITSIIPILIEALNLHEDISISEKEDSKELFDLFSKIEDEFFQHVIVLEDAHHASKNDLDGIIQLLLLIKKTKFKTVFTLIITGRDDYTFPNEKYYSTIDFFNFKSDGHNIFNFKVEQLNDADCRNLISTVIQNIPTSALEKIHYLSENIPFNIIQYIEYLLDVRLVKIINRNTVGIPNISTFNSKVDIPSRIEDLLELRMKALKDEFNKEDILTFLISLSAVGFVFNSDIFSCYFPDKTDNELSVLENELLQRKFLISMDGDKLRFYHENIFHFFKKKLFNDSQAYQRSKHFITKTTFMDCVDEFVRGRIYVCAREYKLGTKSFEPIYNSVRETENYTSEDIPAKYYDYLPSLFEAVYHLGLDQEFLVKIILTNAYMGVHNYPLGLASQNCQSLLDMVSTLRFDLNDKLYVQSFLRQLMAHAMLNAGQLSMARKIMLELSSLIQTKPFLKRYTGFTFDLFDRLQGLFLQYNHLTLAENFNRISKDIAIKAEDKRLMSLFYTSEAGIHLYRDSNKSLELFRNTVKYCRSYSVERNTIHAKISVLVAQILCKSKDIQDLKKYLNQAKKLSKISLEQSYSYSITRSQLVLATLHYLLAAKTNNNFSITERIIEEGINSNLRYGTGIFIWQFYNLLACIYERNKSNTNKVAKFFQTAISYLEHQDLLFLGNLDFCSPNLIVISNYIKFLDKYDTESNTYQFISKLSYYSSKEGLPIDRYKSLLLSVRKFDIIGQNSHPNSLLIDNETKYCLSIS